MLLLLPTKSNKSCLITGLFSVVINFGLVALIYQLTMGEAIVNTYTPVSLAKVYFVADRQVEEIEPELITKLTSAPQLSTPPPMSVNLSLLAMNSLVKIPKVLTDIPMSEAKLQPITLQFSPNGKQLGSQMMTNIRFAKPVFQLPPQYPPAAKQRAIEGFVVLELKITVKGRVQQIKVVQQQPADIFVRSATRAVMRWRFDPPAQTEWQRIIIRYQLES